MLGVKMVTENRYRATCRCLLTWALSVGMSLGILHSGHLYAATYTIATTHYPPYVDASGEVVTGYVIELIRAAMQRMGHEVVFYPVSWTKALQMAERAEVDAIAPIYRNDQRAARLYYNATPLHQEHIRIFYGPWSSPLDDRMEMDHVMHGAILGVVHRTIAGGELDRWMTQHPERVSTGFSYEHLMLLLRTRRVDRLFLDEAHGRVLVRQQHAEHTLREFPHVHSVMDAHIAFTYRPDALVLRAAMDDALKQLQKEGVISRLHEKFLVVPAPYLPVLPTPSASSLAPRNVDGLDMSAHDDMLDKAARSTGASEVR